MFNSSLVCIINPIEALEALLYQYGSLVVSGSLLFRKMSSGSIHLKLRILFNLLSERYLITSGFSWSISSSFRSLLVALVLPNTYGSASTTLWLAIWPLGIHLVSLLFSNLCFGELTINFQSFPSAVAASSCMLVPQFPIFTVETNTTICYFSLHLKRWRALELELECFAVKIFENP